MTESRCLHSLSSPNHLQWIEDEHGSLLSACGSFRICAVHMFHPSVQPETRLVTYEMSWPNSGNGVPIYTSPPVSPGSRPSAPSDATCWSWARSAADGRHWRVHHAPRIGAQQDITDQGASFFFPISDGTSRAALIVEEGEDGSVAKVVSWHRTDAYQSELGAYVEVPLDR